MPIRYMGTKRVLAPVVRSIVDDLDVAGPVVDLFSGMGSVAQALSPKHSVVTNDLLAFTTAFARCRFTSGPRRTRTALSKAVVRKFRQSHADLSSSYRWRLNREKGALADGREALEAWFDEAPHVGNSVHYAREARRSAALAEPGDYRLATLYFATGYFSTAQALEIDALRAALDRVRLTPDERDWAMAAWLLAAGRLVNAPGHTAQFLRPSSDEAFSRIQRTWARSVWPLFLSALDDLGTVGNAKWRRGNRVVNGEALKVLDGMSTDSIGAIYADPPYTKDQYSRYYHVYETLYRYDFPDSSGRARARSDRFSTGFSLATQVEDSLDHLVRRSGELERPLILSYPDDGLLATRGLEVEDIIRRHRSQVSIVKMAHTHSTMGGTTKSKDTTECIYVAS